MHKFHLNPLTRKRLKRFRQTPQAWYSLLLFLILFLVSLCAELLCNSRPLIIIQNGHWYFPFVKFYPEDLFLHNGNSAEPDYLRLSGDSVFRRTGGRILFAPSTCDPYRIVPREDLEAFLRIRVLLAPRPGVASLTVDRDLNLISQTGWETIVPGSAPVKGTPLKKLITLSPDLHSAVSRRLESGDGLPRFSQEQLLGKRKLSVVLSARKQRRRLPRHQRITVREQMTDADTALQKGWLLPGRPLPEQDFYRSLPDQVRQAIAENVAALSEKAPDLTVDLPDNLQLTLHKESVRYPFRPVPGHPFGIDDAGRDILARILYGLRSSLLFGLILVICSMTLGTIAGMLQGYLGGWADITAQRFIEIWSALPFLYVIILLGSIYGTSFSLLIFCYALFNWIGISYYMRAEMLRLRKMPFVEAAKCLGLPGWKIAWKHILPNAMVPLITFFPFSLVGAIGSLAALDYLGFGLPPPTPSLGQLLQQAQNQRWAYWLILYPSLTLFIIMLLGVFIGEGFRNAYDPRRQNRIH